MNQAPFVQIPCVKCGSTVWISPAAGMGYCSSCQTPNQLPPGAAGGAPMGGPPMAGGYGPPPGAPMGGPPMAGGYGPPPGAPMGGPPMGGAPMGGPPMAGGYGPPPGGPMGGPPMGGAPGYPPPGGPMGGPPMGGAPGYPPPGGPMGGPPPGFPQPSMSSSSGSGFGGGGGVGGNLIKTIGGAAGTIVLVIIIAIVKFGFKSAAKSKNTESLSSLGIDQKKADPDKMIAAARAYALKWKSDAGFWSVNILKLKSDGTVDLTSSNVVVEYFSPSAVSSPIQSVRDDSIKKFSFMNEDMVYRDIWGVRKQYNPAPAPTKIPGCTAKSLASKLVGMGLLKSGGTVHAQIDPAFGDEWLVQTSAGPKKFDLATCGERK